MTETRPSFHDLGIATADLWSSRSPDPKVKVGVCILDAWSRVVGVGYNGRAHGEPNERESLEQGMSGFIHAEVNALLAANWNGSGHTLYSTHEPCATCARLIINSRRVSTVVFQYPYREESRTDLPAGSDILAEGGVKVFISHFKNHGSGFFPQPDLC